MLECLQAATVQLRHPALQSSQTGQAMFDRSSPPHLAGKLAVSNALAMQPD